ncbi:MAG: histidine phosphatase family protein [Bacteroidota bacterium]
MLTLYFVRHGQTDYNLKGIVQGSGVDSSLNATGQAQAQAFFEAYRHLTFDAVYASKLQRTHQTLAPWKAAGYDFEQHAGLNELNWGHHEGAVANAEMKAEFLQMLENWQQGEIHDKVVNGESPQEALDRALPFLKQLTADHMGQRVLICSHGRQLRVILSHLMDGDLTQMEQYKHQNTGVTIVRIAPSGTVQLDVLNNGTHLETLPIQ